MSSVMTPAEVLDVFADKAWSAVTRMPEFVLSDWGHPTPSKMDNVIATLLAIDERTVITRSVLLSDVLDPYRVPFQPLVDWSDQSPPVEMERNWLTYRPRNYFVRHAVSYEMVSAMSGELPLFLKVDKFQNSCSFLHVFYMPTDD